MSIVVDSLVEMGFSREKAELAVSQSGSQNISEVMDWILLHENDPIPAPPQAPIPTQTTEEQPSNPPQENEQPHEEATETPQSSDEVVKSIRCNQCNKLFQSTLEVEYHATKSGHDDFSESTEEKKPLSDEEKKEQLARIEAKLKQRRLEREEREKQEALEKERNRIKSGKEMLEAKKKYDEIEMKKIVEQRKREKEDERMARQRVKEQIEQDKLARKAKFSGEPIPTTPPKPASQPAAPQNYSEVVLQIKLTNGMNLVQTFGAKEPLSAVRLFVEMNRKDGVGSFSLMTPYPRKVFGPEDYDVPLETLGLGPRATLIVSKS